MGFGLAVALHAGTFPPVAGQPVGPAFFPRVVGVALVVCGAVLAWSARGQAVPWIELEAWVRQPRRVLNFALSTGALVFYGLAVDTLGFHLTTFLILSVLFIAFSVPNRWVAVIAAAVTFSLHFAFYNLLSVPLPWGWLEEFSW